MSDAETIELTDDPIFRTCLIGILGERTDPRRWDASLHALLTEALAKAVTKDASAINQALPGIKFEPAVKPYIKLGFEQREQLSVIFHRASLAVPASIPIPRLDRRALAITVLYLHCRELLAKTGKSPH